MLPSSAVRGLGEVVLRVRDLASMSAFYQETFGLTPMLQTEQVVFLAVAPGYAGHTQVIALFDESIPADHPHAEQAAIEAAGSPLHHFALAIDAKDYESERTRLEALGLIVRTAEHAWVKWRSLYVRDPEGNVVELVCYDESVLG